MSELALASELPPCTRDDFEETMAMRHTIMQMPQYDIPTEHFFHAGMYVRTVRMPTDCILCGAVIKIPTVVIVSGDCVVKVGNEAKRISGYAILKGSPGRSQIFIAIKETFITMMFPSKAKTLEEAEEEFTDEYNLLTTRRK